MNNNEEKKNGAFARIACSCWSEFRRFGTWYANLYKGRKWYTKTAVAFLSCIVALFLYLGAVDINFLWLFGKSPGIAQIKNPVSNQASEIYSADGVLLGKFFNANRQPVKYNDVNPEF